MKATKGGNFTPIPLPEPQTVIARCYSVVDIGTVKNIYKGEDKGYQRKLYITWEFPTLLAIFNPEKGEEPFVIGSELTASTGTNSNFAKLIAQWRGKPLTIEEQQGFDPMQMVGKTAFISFIHKTRKDFVGQEIKVPTNENTNLKFLGIMPKPKNIEAPPARNKYMIWDWDLVAAEGFEKHKATFEKIPKWLQKKVAESKEFQQYSGGYKLAGNDDQEETSSTPAPAAQAPKTTNDEW